MNGPASNPDDGPHYVLSEDELDDVARGRSPVTLVDPAISEPE